MEEEDGEIEEEKSPLTEQTKIVVKEVELSLKSVVRLVTPGTMKLKGKVGKQSVTILIDCGAIHNFIAIGLVHKLGLPVIATTNYGVILGSQEFIRGKGICKRIVLEMQGLTMVEDFLVVILGGIEVILGIQWSDSLGSMEVNWKLLIMRFKMGNIVMTLKGDHGLRDVGFLSKLW